MVDVADADVVAVLTRAPSAGGKSRLFAALGRPSDPALLSALLLDTIDGVAAAGVPVVVAVTPPGATDAIFDALQVIRQPEGDLGRRMAETMRQLFERGARRVALVGSDLPSITAAPVRDAFRALDADPDAVVLGPAPDGGYYLVAATRVPAVFDGIDWGSAHVLAQTRDAARRAGLRVVFVAELNDVDTPADLQALANGTSRTAAWVRASGIPARRTPGDKLKG
jgi:rSAM/selenodomain-associated transferase 1